MRRALLTLTAMVAIATASFALPTTALAQKVVSTTPGKGGSPHETVEYKVGDATVTIIYGRPFMKGRSLETLAPTGKVYRTGADEATTLKTDKALQIGTLAVPAGTYTLYTLPGSPWQLIVSKQTGQWGTSLQPGQGSRPHADDRRHARRTVRAAHGRRGRIEPRGALGHDEAVGRDQRQEVGVRQGPFSERGPCRSARSRVSWGRAGDSRPYLCSAVRNRKAITSATAR